MDFRKQFQAKLINLRKDQFVDRKTGEAMTYYRLDLVANIDDVQQVVQLTCGPKIIGEAGQWKPGSSVDCEVIPFSRNNRVVPKLVSMMLLR